MTFSKRVSPGFLILELLLAVLIAGVAITMSMQLPRYALRADASFQKRLVSDMQEAKLLSLLEKDFSSVISVATSADKPEKEIGPETKESLDKEAALKKEEKPLFGFYLQGDDGESGFADVSFISTYGLGLQKSIGSRVVRLTYSLEKDKSNPGFFQLYRAESLLLNQAAEKKEGKPKKILVAENLQNFSLQVLEERPEEKPEAGNEEKAQSEPLSIDAGGWVFRFDQDKVGHLPKAVLVKGLFEFAGVKKSFEKQIEIVSQAVVGKKTQSSEAELSQDDKVNDKSQGVESPSGPGKPMSFSQGVIKPGKGSKGMFESMRVGGNAQVVKR